MIDLLRIAASVGAGLVNRGVQGCPMDLAASPLALVNYAMQSPAIGIAQAAQSIASKNSMQTGTCNSLDAIMSSLTNFIEFLDDRNIIYIIKTFPRDLDRIVYNIQSEPAVTSIRESLAPLSRSI